MSGLKRADRVVFGTLVTIVLASTPAHAYIDPGSGSLFLQATLAGMLAVAFAVKTYWRNLVGWVGARFHSSSRHER